LFDVNQDVIDMTRLAFQIPIIGIPYEFLTTGSVRHSAPGSIGQFLLHSAGKRSLHAWLGSAGGKYFTTHVVEIVIEESRNLKTIIRGRPPSAFATLGLGVYLMNNASAMLQDVLQMEPEVL